MKNIFETTCLGKEQGREEYSDLFLENKLEKYPLGKGNAGENNYSDLFLEEKNEKQIPGKGQGRG